jgi:hypothetical protein
VVIHDVSLQLGPTLDLNLQPFSESTAGMKVGPSSRANLMISLSDIHWAWVYSDNPTGKGLALWLSCAAFFEEPYARHRGQASFIDEMEKSAIRCHERAVRHDRAGDADGTT